MDVHRFREIRLSDDILLGRVAKIKNELVAGCKICSGSGFLPSGKRCECLKKFNLYKDVIISGAPSEAIDVYSIINDGRRLEDPDCKQVFLSTEKHEIEEGPRKKKFYADIIKPYIANVKIGAFACGDSIIMFGNNSCGKTWSLYYILDNLVGKYSVMFILLRDFINTVNDMYRDEDTRRNAKNTLDIIRDVDMLLIDEGSKISNFTENVCVNLEALVKDRIGNKKPVVMATNHSPSDFHRNFGPSVVSAFIKNVFGVHVINGPDLRKQEMNRKGKFSYMG